MVTLSSLPGHGASCALRQHLNPGSLNSEHIPNLERERERQTQRQRQRDPPGHLVSQPELCRNRAEDPLSRRQTSSCLRKNSSLTGVAVEFGNVCLSCVGYCCLIGKCTCGLKQCKHCQGYIPCKVHLLPTPSRTPSPEAVQSLCACTSVCVFGGAGVGILFKTHRRWPAPPVSCTLSTRCPFLHFCMPPTQAGGSPGDSC